MTVKNQTETLQSISSELACPACGMPQSEWPDTDGYTERGKTYCCEGCAAGTGCTC